MCLSTIASSRVAIILAMASTTVCSARSLARAEEKIGARALSAEPYQRVHVPDVPLPRPGSGRAVSLDEVLAYADQRAPSLRVARKRLGFGAAAVKGAAPWLPANPQLTVGLGPRWGSGWSSTDYQLSLSQRLEVAGEPGLRRAAARRTRDRFDAELDEARWIVHRDAHAAFHRALVSRERLAVSERLIVFQKRLVEIARGRLQAGDVSPLPVRLAEAEMSQARVTQIGVEQEAWRARIELGTLVGWPAEHPPVPLGQLDLPRDPPSSEALLRVARSHQPRLRTLEAARTEAQAQARVAERDRWPEPTVGVQLTREGAEGGFEETIVLGSLSVPIPLARRNQGERARTQAREEVAGAELSAFTARLAGSIEQHRSTLTAAAARVRTYGVAILPAFEENLRLIHRAFELGEIDILQVSVARERFLRIQTDALDAYADYFRAVANLEGVIGADLWPEERHEHRQPTAAEAPKLAPPSPPLEPAQ